MKTVIIYYSKTGFTEKYAKWLAEDLQCESIPLDKVKNNTLDDYEAIVFGSWCHAGFIQKLKWVKKNLALWKDKKVVVYAVGGSPKINPDVPKALRANFNDEEWNQVHVFYCQGGINYERMCASDKMMMKMFTKMIDKKKDATDGEKEMAGMIKGSYDISDRKYLDPIKECLAEN